MQTLSLYTAEKEQQSQSERRNLPMRLCTKVTKGHVNGHDPEGGNQLLGKSALILVVDGLMDEVRELPQDETWTDFDGPSWIQYDFPRKNKLPGSKKVDLAKFMLPALFSFFKFINRESLTS